MIDISRPVHEKMALYPGNPTVTLKRVRTATATTTALTAISFGSHTGTHLDAPSHALPQGHGTTHFPLNQLNGPCEVIDLTHISQVILGADLPPTQEARLLLKTRNSYTDIDIFDPAFIALADSCAEELVKRGVTLIGIDGPSIKKQGAHDTVHTQLLTASIAIIEGLWLADVGPGRYELLCLPLPLDTDGAPVRAVLRPLV